MYKVPTKELVVEIVRNEGTIIGYKGTELDIELPDKITYNNKTYPITGIKSTAFKGKDITSIKLPASICILGPCAFMETKELRKVELSKYIKTIPNSCFLQCLKLEEINLENVEVIDANAFYNCKSLKDIVINNSIVSPDSFCKSNINSLNITGKTLLDDAISKCYIKMLKINNDCTIQYSKDITIDNIIIAEDAILSLNNISGTYYVNNFGGDFYLTDSVNPIHNYSIKTYDELIKDGYNEMQINQILLGYNDYIMLNTVAPETPNEIFRLLREKNKINAIETQSIVSICGHKQDRNNILKLLEHIKPKSIPDSNNKEENIDLQKL